MKRPSASNAEAFVRCTSSHVLPQHESYAAKTEKGTDGHGLLAAVINRVPGAVKRINLAIPGLYPKIEKELEGVEEVKGEEAYVVDVEKRTSQLIGVNIDRKYEEVLGRKLGPYEVCTSLDVLGRKNGLPWIRDFKFGVYSSWWQLFIQAMAILWLPDNDGTTEVDAGFLFIEDRDDLITITEDAATLYLSDLDDHADALMNAFRHAADLERQLLLGFHYSDLKVVEGKWCQYCGAFPNCPAKWKLAKSMIGLDVIKHIDALTLEQCGEAWLKLAEIKKNIIEKTEAALKVRMRAEDGFPLSDGKKLRVLPMPGRLGFDKEGAFELLRRLGASEDEIMALVKRGESFDTVRKVNK